MRGGWGGDDENGEEKNAKTNGPQTKRTETRPNQPPNTGIPSRLPPHGTHPLFVAAALDCPNPRDDCQHDHGQNHRGPVLSRHSSEAGDGRSERGRSVGRLRGLTVGCLCRSVDLEPNRGDR
jgi:hypothetical protein